MSLEDKIRNYPRTCTCDFCTGKKKWSDNWCGRCGKTQLQAPNWWENYDFCDECKEEIEQECQPPPT